jgi:hypothetical protein
MSFDLVFVGLVPPLGVVWAAVDGGGNFLFDGLAQGSSPNDSFLGSVCLFGDGFGISAWAVFCC